MRIDPNTNSWHCGEKKTGKFDVIHILYQIQGQEDSIYFKYLIFKYLIFVNFGTPPHYLGLYKVHQKVCKFATK